MKPDRGKSRDKARLERKKAQGQAFRAARKEARAVEADPLAGDEARELIDAVRHQRGERRRRAFLALAELDRRAALALVDGLLQDADGSNRDELARLLLWRGEATHIDALVAGRVEGLVIGGFATDEVVEEAAARLRIIAPRLPIADLLHRLRRLGLAPLAFAPAPRAAASLALLGETLARLELEGARGAGIDDVVNALVILAPSALWARRHGSRLASDDPRLALAGLAAGGLAGNVHEDAAVAALVVWLSRLAPAERAARLRAAGLPDSANRLRDENAAALWRLCVLDDVAGGLTDAARASAARSLWRRVHGEAASTLLLRPLLAVDVTVDVAVAVGLDETWDDLAGPFSSSTALRDALIGTTLVQDPRVWPAARALVHEDPLAFAAVAVRSQAPEAVDELLQAIDVEHGDALPALVAATLWTSSLPALRARGAAQALPTLLSSGATGVDVVATLQVLRRFLPRAGALIIEVDGAIDRIVRRFTLSR